MSGIPAGAGQLLGKRLGKFEIVALLALGGTAEIYLARIGGAAGFEKYVVVKCLHDHLADDAEFVRMFLDEARLAAHLDHSNIVQTMELGQHENRYYMVMEFLAGLSLAMIVRRAAERVPGGKLPVPLVLNVLAQAAAGLHYAHDKAMNGKPLNIVHRDISPQNLVISFEGVVKVVDFGIAKAEMRETHTRSGTIKGKFAYMSPEQCVANNVDRRTDVFALGVIGHELLTGRRLFKKPSPYETYQAVIECDVKLPSLFDPAIDRELDALLMRSVAKDKADRYPTAEAFSDALVGYLHHRGISSGPGDVSRFFDAAFGQEIEEHSTRMRELISGRDIAPETGVSWGTGDDPDDDKSSASARLNAGSSGNLGGSSDSLDRAIEAAVRGRAASSGDLASSELAALNDLGDLAADPDDIPAERTRIESNPLEKVNELERMMLAAKAGKPPAHRAVTEAGNGVAGNVAGNGAGNERPADKTVVAPAPTAPPPPAPKGPPGPLPAPQGGMGGMAASDAELERVLQAAAASQAAKWAASAAAAGAGPANEPTIAPNAAASLAGIPSGPLSSSMPAVMPLGGPMPGPQPLNKPPSGRFPDAANLPTMVVGAELGPLDADLPSIPSGVIGGGGELASTQIAPLPNVLDGPHLRSSGGGYPMMSAEMRSQIAIGATVFPSDAPTERPGPADRPTERAIPQPSVPVPPARGSEPSNPQGYPIAQPMSQQMRGSEPNQHGYPQLGNNGYAQPYQSGGYPGGEHLGPHGYPQAPSALPPSGQYLMGPPGSHSGHAMGTPPVNDPARAAALMSPVGPSYPSHNWAATAAAKVRVMPPWLLAALFVGALGLALTLTIVIARALRG